MAVCWFAAPGAGWFVGFFVATVQQCKKFFCTSRMLARVGFLCLRVGFRDFLRPLLPGLSDIGSAMVGKMFAHNRAIMGARLSTMLKKVAI